MKVGDWVRFNYSGLVGMVTHVDEHDCTVQLNGGYRKVLSRGEVQVIEPTEPARTEAHMDKQERDRLRDLTYRRDHAHRRLANLDRETTPRNEVESANRELDHAYWNLQNAFTTETVRRLLDALDAAEQRAEAAERDAARYRWVLPIVCEWDDGEERQLGIAVARFTGADGDAAVDAAIDAERGEQTGEGDQP